LVEPIEMNKFSESLSQIAEQVMRMPEPLVQKQLEDEEEEEELVQPKPAGLPTPLVSPSLESHIYSMKGKGQHMPDATRSFLSRVSVTTSAG
jgi:hypothetical protein